MIYTLLVRVGADERNHLITNVIPSRLGHWGTYELDDWTALSPNEVLLRIVRKNETLRRETFEGLLNSWLADRPSRLVWWTRAEVDAPLIHA